MPERYHTFEVEYERTVDGAIGIDRAIVRCYGSSEFAVLAALKKERPHHEDITILNTAERN